MGNYVFKCFRDRTFANFKLSRNIVDSCYLKHCYLRVPSYIKEYSLDSFSLFSLHFNSCYLKYWYDNVNSLGPENLH